jgi:hypothetical protein
MPTTTTPILIACAAVIAAAAARPNLSGRWQLNTELSENGQAKVEQMHAGQEGGHGPGRHGLGAMFGGGPSEAEMNEARALMLDVAEWLTVTQDGDRIVLTDSNGRVRTLTANGRKESVGGRDVRTKWDENRLASEVSLGHLKVTESYERATNGAQLIVSAKLDMGGRNVTVRRVYDAAAAR